MGRLALMVILCFAFLSILDILLNGFNYPWFTGEAYGCIVGIAILFALFFKAAYKIFMYQPKPKEGSKQ